MSKEFRVGLLAVISLVVLYYGFNFLKGVDFFSPTKSYFAIYSNIGGLQVSNPVIVNGYSVGRVSEIKILQNKSNKVLVEISVDKGLALGKGTKAHLANNDFFGSKAIVLEINDNEDKHSNLDTLNAQVDEGLEALLTQGEVITEDIGTTIKNLNSILLGFDGLGGKLDTAVNNASKTFSKIQITLDTINTQIPSLLGKTDLLINELTTQLSVTAKNANTAIEKVNNLEIEKLLGELNNTTSQLNSLMSKINNGKGSVSKLINEDSLYNNLNQVLINLDKVLVHLEHEPKHFFSPLGKKAKKEK